MAKKKTQHDLPPGAEPEYVSTPPPKVETQKTVTRTVASTVLTCSVPAVETNGYARRRIDLNLSRSQARTLKNIYRGLEEKDARLENGRRIQSPAHAILWLLENAS